METTIVYGPLSLDREGYVITMAGSRFAAHVHHYGHGLAGGQYMIIDMATGRSVDRRVWLGAVSDGELLGAAVDRIAQL